MLKGEAKKQYQRDYMRKKRSNTGSNITDGSNIELRFSKAKQAKGRLSDGA